jgi:hypothetical protein
MGNTAQPLRKKKVSSSQNPREGDEEEEEEEDKNESKVENKKRIYKDAREAFIEGNRLFRESRFDLAKLEYLAA